MVDKTESGSILLFHNDLANTTEALPQILTELKSKGFEFVTVSDLIFWEDYTIDATGEQQPVVQSVLPFDDEEIAAAVSEYSDQLSAAGVSDDQLEQVISAVRNGDFSMLPPQAQEVIAQVREGLEDEVTGTAEDIPDLESEEHIGIVPETPVK